MARSGARLACLVVFMLTIAVPARAQPADEGWLNRANRWTFEMNQRGAAAITESWGQLGFDEAKATPVLEGLSRVVFNFVNEPVAMVSHLVAGDTDAFGRTARRFGINTTLGLGGWYDRAAEQGLPPEIADLGLAMCRYGFPAGPYVVVPVMGPRMMRDAVADVVMGNAVIAALLSPLVGNVLSVRALVLISILDEGAVLAVARGLDPASIAAQRLDPVAAEVSHTARRAEQCAAMAARL